MSVCKCDELQKRYLTTHLPGKPACMICLEAQPANKKDQLSREMNLPEIPEMKLTCRSTNAKGTQSPHHDSRHHNDHHMPKVGLASQVTFVLYMHWLSLSGLGGPWGSSHSGQIHADGADEHLISLTMSCSSGSLPRWIVLSCHPEISSCQALSLITVNGVLLGGLPGIVVIRYGNIHQQ